MSIPTPAVKPAIVYPESDGLPLADNTKQFRWIVTLYGNIAALFREVIDVFVGSNLLWYPVEGEPDVRLAPDVFVVFGRPKGDRRSYLQWKEANVPMTVVFKVLSPSNTATEMSRKRALYEESGVEEYYVYDPDRNRLEVYLRQGEVLRRVRPAHGHVSPRLGIRFDLSGPEMMVFHPDGRRFLTFEELDQVRQQTVEQETQTQQRVELAEQRAEQAEQQAAQSEQRLARLAELSRKARRGQATPEELQELDRLEEQASP